MAKEAPVGAAVELTAHYYRANFIALCAAVQSQYGDLLQPAERELLTQFHNLDHAAQCLYVRLVSRVGPLFRVARLEYPEIGALETPLAALGERGLVVPVDKLTVEEMGGIYTRAELYAAFGQSLDLPLQYRKEQLLEGIAALELGPGENFSGLSGTGDNSVVCVHGGEVVQLLQLLFFGNRHQSLTDFILSDLGVATYYPYPLDREHRLFCCRAAVDEYSACGEWSETLHELRETEDVAGIAVLAREILDREMEFSSSLERWQRLSIRVARELERHRELELALSLYGRCRLHPARERTARILESRQAWDDVIALCRKIECEPWCEAELEAAGRILRRVNRKSGIKSGPRQQDRFAEVHLVITAQSDSVEQDVANHLASDWLCVHYLENSLMNTLFGLAFWEQIFSGVSGAFHNPYQSAPADMFAGGFRARRAGEIDARLDMLRRVDLREELKLCRERFENYQCRWVDWSRVSAEIQDRALAIIPGEHLLAIWERQLFDPKENRSGFPDLVAFGDRPGDYCMIEVKGPGDALQDNQKRWLRYFARHDIPARVAWVEWKVA